MAGGCRTCHEVRVNREITRIKLITTTSSALCLTCHSEKNAADLKGHVHAPAVRDCVKCHDPHASENKNQLLKTTSGDKNENLCLACHAIGVSVPAKGSRHAALDMGCETCHVTHKVGAAQQREFNFHLTKATPALCLDCHDPQDAKIAESHRNQPIANSDCLTCHDPHQSASPKLLQKFVHQPFAEQACDACHEAPKDGKVVLTQADARALCIVCHEEKATEIASAKVQHVGAQGDCTQCHDPHAGKTPGFVRPDPVSACTACHSDQGEMQHSKKFLHQPAFKDGCATCHKPHGGDNAKLLRAEGNALCLNCHSAQIKPQKVKDAPLVTIFDGAVRLPENYFNKVPRLNLKFNMGHPTANHPVTDYVDPLDPKKVTKIACLTCHQPHAGGAQALLVTNTRPTAKFCRTCHEGMIGAKP